MRKVVTIVLVLCGLGVGGLLSCGGSQCSPSNCAGCCSAAGLCMGGSALDACGAGGGICSTCIAGQSCNAGRCEAAQTGCGPGNCAGGCCQGGVCKAGTENSACGTGGGACASCPSAQACNASKVCEAPSSGCTTTCSGCCVGNTCNPGNATSACGAGGAACTTCTSSQYCEAGQCKASCQRHSDCATPTDVCIGSRCVAGQGRTYTVTAVSATVPSTDSTGAAWDAFGGAPDPFVCLYLDGSATAVSCSGPPGAADTFTPAWNKNWDVTVSAATKVGITAWDEDTSAHDVIEAFEWGSGAVFLGDARTGGFNGVAFTGGRVTWNITITPKP